jgi:lipoprotein-anchoring transpeptidase ErfK/SrfK
MSRGIKVLIVVTLIVGAGALFYRLRQLEVRRWAETARSASALYEAGDYEAAARLLKKVYARNPESPDGREAFCRYLVCAEAVGGSPDIAAGWRRVVTDPRLKKYHQRGFLSLAREAYKNRKFDDAERYCNAALSEDGHAPLAGDAYALLAKILRDEDKPLTAMEYAQKVVDEYPGAESITETQRMLGDLHIENLFSRAIVPGTEEYVVQPGDSLDSIARHFDTTVDLLREMNEEKVRDDNIRVNDRLKVTTDTFSILIDKSANSLSLKAGEQVVKAYPVGTGKEGTTPVGEFKITNKIKEPEWFKPGGGIVPYGEPENLLGTRWMGIDSPGYGIHGTWEPETVGSQSSAGCVRLLNRDVEELFTIVPVGTKVKIVE